MNDQFDRDEVRIRGESGSNGSLARTKNGVDHWCIEFDAALQGRSAHGWQECKDGMDDGADGNLMSDAVMGLLLYPKR